MATPAPSLDTVITVKVNYQGATRRAKMPLRDTTPRILEEQIRVFLHIPKDTEIILERYSDSAGAYVLLEPTNTAVYKQLYRAAKAKSKLKLRVSHKPSQEAVVPKPVTVEDVLDSPQEPSANSASSAKTLCTDTKPMVPTPPPRQSSAAVADTHEPTHSTPSMDFYPPISLPSASTEQRQSPVEQGYKQVLDRFLPPQCPRFAICCNSCERTTPDIHYHCSTCDDGDFDLCQDCVDKGVSCYGTDHWLIKRANVDGQIVNSTTEKIAPKPKAPKAVKSDETEMSERQPWSAGPSEDLLVDRLQKTLDLLDLNSRVRENRCKMRTCNQCVQELPETQFLHCQDCEDYDLCSECFGKDAHGHHPQHAFEPAVADTDFSAQIQVRLAPGRNRMHHAICDKCDKFITGVRHKCLDCPDWDYCMECAPTASTTHPGHRFVPVYEPLKANPQALCPAAHNVHTGICCDGPLCSSSKGYPAYIRGIRYKCAVCHDVDFCASCEASPANQHNKTHPLIKFSTPVRHVSVTTHGEHADGQRMPVMGDQAAYQAVQSQPQLPRRCGQACTRPLPERLDEEEIVKKSQVNVDDQPAKTLHSGYMEMRERQKAVEEPKVVESADLKATFVEDSIRDGTIVNADTIFEQTWVLRNDGRTAWPVGCSVRFVGGDYMGRPSSRNPVATKALSVANVTNATTQVVAPGEQYAFTVQLRAPPRIGTNLSFWRLATPQGTRFGHRLWCDIRVRNNVSSVLSPPKQAPVAEVTKDISAKPQDEITQEIEDNERETVVESEKDASTQSSQMIFPKLEKESPEASIHQGSCASPKQAESKSIAGDEFEDCSKETDWEGSDDDFLTDEEYDILDASDEDFIEEQTKPNKL